MTVIRCRDLIRCRFPAAANPVVKGVYCDIVLATPVGICHAALAAFSSAIGTRALRVPAITYPP